MCKRRCEVCLPLPWSSVPLAWTRSSVWFHCCRSRTSHLGPCAPSRVSPSSPAPTSHHHTITPSHHHTQCISRYTTHTCASTIVSKTLASSPGPHEEKRAWYPLRAHAQFHQVFLVLGYLCNPLRIILWYTSGYFPCYAIPKRRRPRWRHFAVLLTSEAHKRSEQTRSSSYLHTNSLDTCTVKNACGFTACYPENLLSYLVHAHAVDTRPSFLREGLGGRG